MLELNDEKENGIVVCRMEGRLDGSTSTGADEHLGRLAQEAATSGLVIDLARLEYVSSAGLRVLLQVANRLKTGNGKLALFGLNDHVRQVFDIAGFSSILDIYPSRKEAVEHVESVS